MSNTWPQSGAHFGAEALFKIPAVVYSGHVNYQTLPKNIELRPLCLKLYALRREFLDLGFHLAEHTEIDSHDSITSLSFSAHRWRLPCGEADVICQPRGV